MVCLNVEFDTHKVVSQTLTGPAEGQRLLDLGIPPLSRGHGPRYMVVNLRLAVSAIGLLLNRNTMRLQKALSPNWDGREQGLGLMQVFSQMTSAELCVSSASIALRTLRELYRYNSRPSWIR